MPKEETIFHHFQGYDIPIKVYKEFRNGSRYAFTSKQIIFRIPKTLLKSSEKAYIEKGLKWVEKTLRTKPGLLDKVVPKSYPNNFIIRSMDQDFRVVIIPSTNENSSFKKVDDTINIKISQNHVDKTQVLLSKVFRKIHKAAFEREVHEINSQLFKKEVNTIRLKYNKTNWGSCSTKKNLNFSTRCLLLPKWLRSYIIVHELSHLLEMNHSHRFWKEVEKRYPEYKKAEKFLTEKGHQFDF
ncbi:MAG TPA: M48 family metallopeptidase [Saprospiraceae bacterium]|nr:M48 family metallopeptidase [Saprospiraceae bacterium]HPK09306.1 M48 family metallopeptidase [Saprospiraceae bacterium]HPQ20423.1 M48 family metallopeptidase [Saprospiraceae bacterium]